mmetsp:Transcript_12257/g.24451  ORF Transcript_12257/g.24451 Transcript_12257/m.24451 type:complete len:933 (+) Transcript_12257:132-2930(+)
MSCFCGVQDSALIDYNEPPAPTGVIMDGILNDETDKENILFKPFKEEIEERTNSIAPPRAKILRNNNGASGFSNSASTRCELFTAQRTNFPGSPSPTKEMAAVVSPIPDATPVTAGLPQATSPPSSNGPESPLPVTPSAAPTSLASPTSAVQSPQSVTPQTPPALGDALTDFTSVDGSMSPSHAAQTSTYPAPTAATSLNFSEKAPSTNPEVIDKADVVATEGEAEVAAISRESASHGPITARAVGSWGSGGDLMDGGAMGISTDEFDGSTMKMANVDGVEMEEVAYEKHVNKVAGGAVPFTEITDESNDVSPEDDSNMDYLVRRDIATKVLGSKLIKGYILKEVQCLKCSMPLMEYRGVVNCVVCPVLAQVSAEALQEKKSAILIEQKKKDAVRKKREEARNIIEEERALALGDEQTTKGEETKTAEMTENAEREKKEKEQAEEDERKKEMDRIERAEKAATASVQKAVLQAQRESEMAELARLQMEVEELEQERQRAAEEEMELKLKEEASKLKEGAKRAKEEQARRAKAEHEEEISRIAIEQEKHEEAVKAADAAKKLEEDALAPLKKELEEMKMQVAEMEQRRSLENELAQMKLKMAEDAAAEEERKRLTALVAETKRKIAEEEVARRNAEDEAMKRKIMEEQALVASKESFEIRQLKEELQNLKSMSNRNLAVVSNQSGYGGSNVNQAGYGGSTVVSHTAGMGSSNRMDSMQAMIQEKREQLRIEAAEIATIVDGGFGNGDPRRNNFLQAQHNSFSKPSMNSMNSMKSMQGSGREPCANENYQSEFYESPQMPAPASDRLNDLGSHYSGVLGGQQDWSRSENFTQGNGYSQGYPGNGAASAAPAIPNVIYSDTSSQGGKFNMRNRGGVDDASAMTDFALEEIFARLEAAKSKLQNCQSDDIATQIETVELIERLAGAAISLQNLQPN